VFLRPAPYVLLHLLNVGHPSLREFLLNKSPCDVRANFSTVNFVGYFPAFRSVRTSSRIMLDDAALRSQPRFFDCKSEFD